MMNRPTATPSPIASPADRNDGRQRLSFRLSRQIFLRGLALVYLSAFLSMASQADGLIGRQGLLPVHEFLASRPADKPASLAWRYPTLLWVDHSDATIDAICLGGAMAATLVALGLLQAPMLLGCFVLYLSVAVGGQQFFDDTPWDSLLLETGFLAIFLAPWQLSLKIHRQAEPSGLLLWLVWWLLFRLLFGSGLAKITLADPSWRDGTALLKYFVIQPLPVFTSWYAARLPAGLLSAATWGLLFAELVLPFAILLGRWGRRLVCLPLAAVQVLILATGNYGFLNYLALVLCLSLLDDAAWHWIARSLAAPYRWIMRSGSPRTASRFVASTDATPYWRWPKAVPVLIAVLLVPVSVVQLLPRALLGSEVLALTEPVVRGLRPWRIVNSYGIYGVMPSERVEMIIEASRDGVNWRPYEFRFKPGDITREPRVAAPHMPRLDWLMWSLRWGDPKEQLWFQSLLKGLLEQRKPVVGLIASAPFEENPAFLRVRTFRYHLASPSQRSEGYWWRRDYLFDSIGAIWLRDRPPIRNGSQTRPVTRPVEQSTQP
ncbi:lipase maturation factor family protein [Humisphaera borealis]|uniref:Lipase maturation factor family protein n=1 Tax=Humisphaera borealis TaxID=2807512 RepID=A0A7M2X1C7_9BACT|nr:lipase maturation factor family protein [Humisphaera borealis]QOV91474.1 lipase maturation factor family protein [Humisphaera borealis]